jgi:hypothetical protein
MIKIGVKRLLVILVTLLILLGSGSCALAFDTTRTTSTIWRGKSEVDVLLRVETDDKWGNIHNLLANPTNPSDSATPNDVPVKKMDSPDVPLPNKYTGMMDTLRKTTLEHLSLQPSLQEIFNLQSQHVIETHAGFVEHTNTNQSTDKSVTLEKTFGILVIKFEKFTGSTTNFGKDEGDTPDFTLVTETVLAGEVDHIERPWRINDWRDWDTYLELSIETSWSERSTGDLITVSPMIARERIGSFKMRMEPNDMAI